MATAYLRAKGRDMIVSVAVALIITLGLWFIVEVLLKADKPRERKR